MQQDGKYNVLYIDDEEDNLLVFKSAFRRFYNIFTAKSALEGLELIKENVFAVIITDQRMPVTTGVEFLQNLPDDPENIRMILSGYSDVQAIIEAINTGKVYRYINKPWDRENLKVTIDHAIDALNSRMQMRSSIQKLEAENSELKQQVFELKQLHQTNSPSTQARI